MAGVLSSLWLSYDPQTRWLRIKSKRSDLVHRIDTHVSLRLEVYQLKVHLAHKAKTARCVHSLILVLNWEIVSGAINSKWIRSWREASREQSEDCLLTASVLKLGHLYSAPPGIIVAVPVMGSGDAGRQVACRMTDSSSFLPIHWKAWWTADTHMKLLKCFHLIQMISL